MKVLRVAISAAAFVLLALLTGSGGSGSALAANPVYPVVSLGSGAQCILGGSSGGKWVKAEDMQKSVTAGTKYKLYSLSGYLGTSTGSKPVSIGEPCVDTLTVNMSPERTSRYDVFAVAGTWPAMPRLPRLESTSQAVYVKAVSDVLKQKGIANPTVKIQQVIRVDLEGDGSSEVLISATRYALGSNGYIPAASRAGDYSVVLMRKVVRGQVQTSILADEVYTKDAEFNAPSAYQIAGVLDLNGDKTMEVVLHGQYYEGDWHSVVQVKGTQSQDVLDCGCGV